MKNSVNKQMHLKCMFVYMYKYLISAISVCKGTFLWSAKINAYFLYKITRDS